MKLKVLLAATILLVGTTTAFSFGNQQGKAAIVQLSGTISPSSGGFGSSGITPEAVREVNKKVENGNFDAVIYEINSGGGAVVASKEVMRSIEDVKVPTVCRIRDTGASGAYLASLGCDRIVADSASLTGSIGVKASYLEFSGLLEKYGIEYVNLTSGELKDVGSQLKNASERDKKVLKKKIDRIHDQFIAAVDEERNLTEDQREEVRTGEPFLGTRAKKLGLVDRLGGRETSVEVAENLTGSELSTEKVQATPSFSLLNMFGAEIDIPLVSSESLKLSLS